MSSIDSTTRLFKQEKEEFDRFYRWLENQMPPPFYEEIKGETLLLLARNLMGLPLQDYFCRLHLKGQGFVICLDAPEADLKILGHYDGVEIKNYRSYVSSTHSPFPGIQARLKIASISFTEPLQVGEKPSEAMKADLMALAKHRNPLLTDVEFEEFASAIDLRFLKSLSVERLVLALDLFFKAKSCDDCRYEVRYNEDWKEKGTASMQIVLAWRNTPKNRFLYRMARVIHRHHLVMENVNAIHVNPHNKDGVLLMSLGLHGSGGEAAWDVSDILDFLRELVTVKYFEGFDRIDSVLVVPGHISGNMGNLLRAMVSFIHQGLVQVDANLYTVENIIEAFCRHPDLTKLLCEAFQKKFDPWNNDYKAYQVLKDRFIRSVQSIDTGQSESDTRRKNVLFQGIYFVEYTLKTNFYRMNMTAFSFRLDPRYLDEIPFDRSSRFPELPYAIIFVRGMHFFGFHIRFRDLARGGVRTIYPKDDERAVVEVNRVFSECYQLAYTQQKKNKDIPEGGAKAVIFLRPYARLEEESEILLRELDGSGMSQEEIKRCVEQFRTEQHTEYLYHAQRSFIDSLLVIVNCDAHGKLRGKYILDFWKKPEYLYLGPDENMHDSMIEWIASFSKQHQYKPKGAFISGKPSLGINHKAYGVTSLGLNIYVESVLQHLGIDPRKDCFKVKIAGGPDGDVAGNEILNLFHHYPRTAKIVALTDVSGTIHDPEGLDLAVLAGLFKEGKAIRYYPVEKLHEGGFLVDRESIRMKGNFIQQMLMWKKVRQHAVDEWCGCNEMNNLWRSHLHAVPSDIFIPAGGRPRTLNGSNVGDFCDALGKPTAKAIVEGANIYLDDEARHFLEDRGVLIIKDSSANKTGVVCSSFEVLCGLVLTDEEFIRHREQIVLEILERLKRCARLEAQLLLRTLSSKRKRMTEISDAISAKINQFTDQLLEYLDGIDLVPNGDDPFMRCFLDYSLPFLRRDYEDALIREVPDNHKKAIIACHLAAELVYERGIDWQPTVVDILPLILKTRQAIV